MYTIGCDQRRGTTSVSSRATHMLTGNAMMTAISDGHDRAVHERHRAELAGAGSQSVEKIPDSPPW